MWGIIPAAGNGMRIQPLAFSKELLPVGSRTDPSGMERPRAVSEYLVERLMRAGARKLCFVISPGKSDIVQYYGGHVGGADKDGPFGGADKDGPFGGADKDGPFGGADKDGQFGGADIAYVIQNEANGLCDAIFRAVPFVRPDEPVVIGLPDTIWFPEDALCRLPDDVLSFLLFEVDRPALFDAVVTGDAGQVQEIQVKSPEARSNWIWGAFKMPGHVLHALHALWLRRGRQDEYVGTLVNAWIAAGGRAVGVRAGEHYVDVGTLGGYRQAIRLLETGSSKAPFELHPFRRARHG